MKAKSLKKGEQITPPKGKLGVLIPGIGGAVSTTFIAGVELVRRGLAEPVGSLTQLGTIRLGKRFEHRSPKIKDFVPLAGLDDLVFGGWDIYEANCFEAALYARVLKSRTPRPGQRLPERNHPDESGFRPPVRQEPRRHLCKKRRRVARQDSMQLKADIADFKKRNSLDRCVMIWCGSTEVHMKPQEIHGSIDSLQKAIDGNDPNIPPSMLYALAALESGVPFINGAPNLTLDVPAMIELAELRRGAHNGKRFQDRSDADEDNPCARP